MDSIRYIILGGLAVVSYLLLLAWQADNQVAPQTSPSRPETELSRQFQIFQVKLKQLTFLHHPLLSVLIFPLFH